MAQKDWPGGYIRPVPVDPAGPYQDGAAPGVWTLDQVAYWVKQGLWPIAGNLAPIGLFGGGTSLTNVIQKIIISSTGNSTDFGDLTLARNSLAACSSNIRGVFAGGVSGGFGEQNIIDYVLFSSAGNATDFGDLLSATSSPAGASNYVRGLFAGGVVSASNVNVIQYITIASTGNATDFGDLTITVEGPAGCSSSTRALFGGGDSSGTTNVISYVTIASTGNATDFGDLLSATSLLASSSSDTRGLFGGGSVGGSGSNVIAYVTIATTGNATDFGDLTVARVGLSSCASDTRGVFGGGQGNVIDYVTIASTGNATDFGDLLSSLTYLSACSSAASAVQPTPTSSEMAFFVGGETSGSGGGGSVTTINYVNIATTGNAYMWGGLLVSRYALASCASSTRGISAGGYSTPAGNNVNSIEYLTLSSFGNGIDFGDFSTGTRYEMAGLSNETRGLFSGGRGGSLGSYNNVIDYITIATTGDSTDFGDLTQGVTQPASCASTTRGVIGGGQYFSGGTLAVNIISYVTIASAGNATNFGDLTQARYYLASCSSSTRGLFAGGFTATNVIDYITIASAGNATDFGDLLESVYGLASASSTTRGLFAGGRSSDRLNVIQYVTIESTGNSVDFGDLLVAVDANPGGFSNCHGGL